MLEEATDSLGFLALALVLTLVLTLVLAMITRGRLSWRHR